MSNARNLANLLGTGTQITTADIADGAFQANKNLVINGAMQVAQRGDVTGITGGNVFGGADRFVTNGTSFGTVSLVQEADAPEGFAESQRVKFTTARSTTGAGDHFVIGTRLEGQDLQRFKKGTSNAESMTVSFYAKASQATTIQLELFDNDNTRHAAKEFAITTSWARYSYTFAGDTTGAFDNDNNLSLYVFFWLGAGTDFTSGTNPDGSWISNDTSRRINSAVGTTFMDTLNAEFNLTGVQLELGETATPFEHRSYADELARCQRYLYMLDTTGNAGDENTPIFREGATAGQLTYYLPTNLRTTPSITGSGYGRVVGYDTSFNVAVVTVSAMGIRTNINDGQKIDVNITHGSLSGGYVFAHHDRASSGAGNLAFDAEL